MLFVYIYIYTYDFLQTLPWRQRHDSDQQPTLIDPRPPSTRLAWEVIISEDALIVIIAIVLQMVRNAT